MTLHYSFNVYFMRTGICCIATPSHYRVINTTKSSVLYLMAFFSPVSSLFAAVVRCNHQVAVRAEVFDGGGLAADRGYLALHSGNLEHAAWVMFQQVALEGLPASTDSHHHVFIVQHLQKEIGLCCDAGVSEGCFNRCW